MAELPSSWGLTSQVNEQGKTEITGKTDAGEPYLVRTCDGPGITERDVAELRAADRDAYPNREVACNEFIKGLVGEEKKVSPLEGALTFDDSDWIEAAMPAVEAGFGRKSFGYSRAFARNFDTAFGEKK